MRAPDVFDVTPPDGAGVESCWNSFGSPLADTVVVASGGWRSSPPQATSAPLLANATDNCERCANLATREDLLPPRRLPERTSARDSAELSNPDRPGRIVLAADSDLRQGTGHHPFPIGRGSPAAEAARQCRPPVQRVLVQRLLPALFALATLLPPAVAAAGPWVPDPGHGFLQLGTTWFRSADPARGASTTGFDYSKTTLSAYGEIGIPGGLLFTLEVPWAAARNDARDGGEVYRNRSFGDLRIALDKELTTRLPLTFGVEVKIPAYTDPSEADAANGVSSEEFPLIPSAYFPAVGDNAIDVLPRVQIGHSFHPLPMWIQGAVGYRIRTCQRHDFGLDRCRDLRDGLSLNGSFGAYLYRRFLFAELYGAGEIPLQPTSDRTIPTQRYVYLQGKLSGSTGGDQPLTVTAGVGGIPRAQNAQRGLDLTLAVSWRF